MIAIQFPEQLAERLQKRAEQSHVTVPQLVEELLEYEDEDEPQLVWTPEELRQMSEDILNPTPMTGEEIAALGLMGGWADKGITDSVEWVAEQRRKRRAKGQW